MEPAGAGWADANGVTTVRGAEDAERESTAPWEGVDCACDATGATGGALDPAGMARSAGGVA